MKKLFSFLLMLSCAITVFAADGALWGEKNIKVATTKWFEIVYPQSCEETAKVLYANADDIYEEIAERYGMDIQVRIPVTLTTSVELYNAYYSSGFYNRIVLYVAPPMDECNVEPDDLLKTFQHELTHAYTYNLKNKFWRGIAKVFGDPVGLSILTVTSGMAEGATVTSESADGAGRLNDEYAKQSVKQAKIEGKFPEFNDVQGSRDIYPSGSFYYFNGAFHEWLQKKYGMKPYTKWWFNCVNVKALTIRRAFKKAYGFKLIDAWNQFSLEYQVPEVEPNPVTAKVAKDFFAPNKSEYSIYNAQGGLPISVSLSEKGLTYVDDKCAAVYFVSAEQFGNDLLKPKRLFNLNYVETARQSKDGRFIAVSYYTDKNATYRYYTNIYDTKKNNWYKISETGIKDASLVQYNGDTYLVALKFHGEERAIRITKLIFEKDKIAGEESPVFIEYNRKQLPQGFVDLQNGNFAFAFKEAMNHYIGFASLDGQMINKVPVPYDRMVLRYLSYSDGELYFSWTQPGSMPRLGKYSESNGFMLSNTDLSGGVYYPVKLNDEVVYIGQFYTSNKILRIKDDTIAITDGVIDETADLAVAEIKWSYADADSITDFNPKKYNPFKFFTRGVFLPFAEVTSNSYDPEHAEDANFDLPIGITYITSNPWGTNNLIVSAGYGIATNSAGFDITFSGGTDTSLFNYTLEGSSEFDGHGWKQANGNVGITSKINVGKTSAFVINPQSKIHIGRSNANVEEKKLRIEELKDTNSSVINVFGDILGVYSSYDMTNYIYTVNQVSLYYQNIFKTEDTVYGKTGFMIGCVPYYQYNATLDGTEEYQNLGDVSFFARVFIPRLLPIKCVEGEIYNFPTRVFAGIFSPDIIAKNMINSVKIPTFACVNVETMLFNIQIQKAIPGLPMIYVNDFSLCLGATFGTNYTMNTVNDSWRFTQIKKYYDEFKNGEFVPEAIISFKGVLGLVTTNFGAFANSNFKEQVYLGGVLDLTKGETTFSLDAGFYAVF